MKVRALVTTFSTTLVVAVLAAAWGIASPLAVGCADAVPLNLISAAPTESSQFVDRINALRASQGLGALQVDGNLSAVAQDWATNMASQDGISHRLDLTAGISLIWKRLGENVGMGPSVNDLMNAFIDSPGHYKNLVDPSFTHVGVGTVRTPDGLMYTAHEFAYVEGVAATPPVTVPVTAPKVTVPVTTPRVQSTPAPTAAPTTVAPAPEPTPTTEPAVEIERSAPDDDELEDRSAENDEQQQNQDEGRCRSHTRTSVVAAPAASISRGA